MTAALLDPLTHHCDIVETGNESWRFKNRACSPSPIRAQSWSRLFEQDSAKVKWTAARVGPLQFRARGVVEGGRSPTGDTSCARRKIHAAAARGDGVK